MSLSYSGEWSTREVKQVFDPDYISSILQSNFLAFLIFKPLAKEAWSEHPVLCWCYSSADHSGGGPEPYHWGVTGIQGGQLQNFALLLNLGPLVLSALLQECLKLTGATAKNSWSLLRHPGPPDQSLRGSSTNFPFWPGQCESITHRNSLQ